MITPQIAANAFGGLVLPGVSLAIREELAQYLEHLISVGERSQIIHELYMVLLILQDSDARLRRYAGRCV